MEVNLPQKNGRSKSLLQKRMQSKKSVSSWKRKGGGILVGLLIILTILGIFHVIWQSPSNGPSASNNIALVFAGTPITEQQIDTVKVQHAKVLLQNNKSFQSPTNFSDQALDDYALYTLFDKIEANRQILHYKLPSVDALMTYIVPKKLVSAKLAHVFYKNHSLFFTQSSPRIHVREIVVRDPHLAQWISQQLLKGTSFAQLALQHSVDPQNYRLHSGDLGWIRPGQMSEMWDSVAFSLHAGQISNIFQTGNLYFIIQVLEGPSYDTIPYNDVSVPVPIIAAQYLQQQEFLEWLSAKIVDEPITVRIPSYETVVSNAITDLHIHSDQGLSDGIHF